MVYGIGFESQFRNDDDEIVPTNTPIPRSGNSRPIPAAAT